VGSDSPKFYCPDSREFQVRVDVCKTVKPEEAEENQNKPVRIVGATLSGSADSRETKRDVGAGVCPPPLPSLQLVYIIQTGERLTAGQPIS
jgi:hypothetical protein